MKAWVSPHGPPEPRERASAQGENRNGRKDRHEGERIVVLRGTSPAADGAVLARHPSRFPLNNLELAERLGAASPALAALRILHVRTFGWLVPHLFMGDVLAHVGACLAPASARQGDARRADVTAILGVLEAASATADRETRHVIAASFLTPARRGPSYAELEPLLGRGILALRAHGKR